VRMGSTINSKTAVVGQSFMTTTTEPIYSSGGIEVIPAGSQIRGRVSSVQKAVNGGKPGIIDVTFNAVILPDGRRYAMNGMLTSLDKDGTKSNEEGAASGKKTSNRKVKFIGGGAAGGAVIGAIAAGGKGSVIGGLIGGGGGLLTERFTKGKDAEVSAGTEFGVLLNRAISLPRYR
jgi:hypothetical protein